MPEVRPFQGLMYRVPKNNLSKLLCPPYDVVSMKEEKKYLRCHPLNMVRLELPFKLNGGSGRYQKAARTLAAWRHRHILVRDDIPSFYVLETHFLHPITKKKYVRRGFFGAVRVVPWGNGIYRHEMTLPKPLQDRMRCLKSMKAQVSPIFGIFEDPRKNSLKWLKNPKGALIAEASFPAGMRHRLYRLHPKGVVELSALLSLSRIVIADGHHRYETAMSYAMQHEKRVDRDHPALFTLMYLCPEYDQGLPVFPTHRGIIAKNKWLSKARKHGALYEHRSIHSLIKEVETKPGWGIYEDGKYYFQPAPVGSVLPVQNLHGTVLAGLQKKDMVFLQDPKEITSMVNRGEIGAGFFLRALKVNEILNVATSGDVLPSKSTYFYPKVPAGLVLYLTKELL